MIFFSKLFGAKKEPSDKIWSLGKLAFLEVDMHNHLFTGIDDGCTSIDNLLELIKGLNGLGLHKFICTPHIMDSVHPNTKATINTSYNSLQSALTEQKSKVKIYAAAEHMIDDGISSLIAKDKLSVLPGGYVLIEMSYLAESKALFQTILDIQNLGYKPILAHPERYNYYHYTFNMYKQIKDAGCLLHLNLLSISRYAGADVKVAALTVLESGMYDFVGTDPHHKKHLEAIQDVVAKYPIRDLLKTCNILNPTLLNHLDLRIQEAVG